MGIIVPPEFPFLGPAAMYNVIMRSFNEPGGIASCSSVLFVGTSGLHTGQVILDWLAAGHECEDGEGLNVHLPEWAEKIMEIWDT